MAGRSALHNRRDHQEIAEQLSANRTVRCAIYTRKSTEEGLQQEFNSLDAQREAAEAFIASQRHEGWTLIPDSYDDGGFTGANMERPALKRLRADIEAEKVDCVVVYKVDRLSRSLLDFARMVEIFEKRGVSFVSVTQQFNTTASLGRLTLNILSEQSRKFLSSKIESSYSSDCRSKACHSLIPAEELLRVAARIRQGRVRRTRHRAALTDGGDATAFERQGMAGRTAFKVQALGRPN
jgi:site-specific DNA recombinase